MQALVVASSTGNLYSCLEDVQEAKPRIVGTAEEDICALILFIRCTVYICMASLEVKVLSASVPIVSCGLNTCTCMLLRELRAKEFPHLQPKPSHSGRRLRQNLRLFYIL